MKVSEIFPSKYVHGAELEKPVTVTIAEVRAERMYRLGEGQVTGYVMYVERGTKGVILNKTLATAIAGILKEDNTDYWPGKRIVIYGEPVTVAGKDLITIRARAVGEEVGNRQDE